MKEKFIIKLCAGIIVGSALLYFINFHNGFAKDGASWGSFADYLAAFIAMANLVVFFWFSHLVFKYNANRDSEADGIRASMERPVIIFKSSKNAFGAECWKAVNIGNGPALNLKIAEARFNEDGWQNPVKCYSLGKDDSVELVWMVNTNTILAFYSDLLNKQYVSMAGGDETKTSPMQDHFINIQIGDKIINKTEMVEVLKKDSQRMQAAINNYRPKTDISVC